MNEKQRAKMEELAEDAYKAVPWQYVNNMSFHSCYTNGFKKGFTAAIEMQNCAEVEFDERAAEKFFENSPGIMATGLCIGSFINGAKWQHSQDAVKLAQLQQEVERMDDLFIKRAEELKKQLAASQAREKVLREACDKIADDHFVASYQQELRELKKIAKTALAETEARNGKT